MIDTVILARKKHPGARVGLDALCKHYGIDNSHRTLHGALLDSEILAEVYLELLGGRQSAMQLGLDSSHTSATQNAEKTRAQKRPVPLNRSPSEQDIRDHSQLLETLSKQPIWLKYTS